MLTFILISVGLIVLCSVFAVVGSRIGAKMEEKNFGAGSVETSMNSGLDASTLGGMLGIVPFLIFVVVLVITVITSPAHPDEHASGGGESAAAAGH